MQYLVIPELMEYFNSFIRKWSTLADRVILTSFNTFQRGMAKISFDESKWLGNPAHRTPCQKLWSDISIHFDGTIVPCCVDWNGRMPLGNINETSARKIWHGDKITWLRKMHIEKRWNEITMCRNCDIYKHQFTKEWIKLW
jgi:radical SAM protein with 4Fe4S-binding SPASM domain